MTSGAGRRWSSRTEGEFGANLVEFAFVMPLLALFLFGIVQFGIAYDKQQSINSAAREGARLAALDTTTLVDIATRATDAYDASAATGDHPLIEVHAGASSVLVGSRDKDDNYDVPNPVTASPTPESEAGEMPCGQDPPSAFVRVVVSTPYDITIPFWGVQTVTIDSTAEFRCE